MTAPAEKHHAKKTLATGEPSTHEAKIACLFASFEWMPNPNWSAKAHYLYYDFDVGNNGWTIVIAGMSRQAPR
jgi:hypothetical protein